MRLSGLQRSFEKGLAQWPPLAFAWSIHGALVFYLYFAYVPADAVGLGQRLLLAAGIALLLLLEVGLLVLANGLFEALTGPLGAKRIVDAIKSLAAATAVGLLAASILKFTATSVHLKRTDLWFAYSNFRQILGEAHLAELVGFLIVPVGVLVIAAGLYLGLRRFRNRERRPRPWVALALVVVAALGSGLFYTLSPPLRLFTGAFVPEVHWLESRFKRPFEIEPATPAAAPSELGRPMRPYVPGAGFEPLNVVLVMLESIPWQRTAPGGGLPGVAPRLDALAAESVVFSHAYAASTHSDYAQMAILSSLHPRKYDRHDYYVRIEYPRTLIWDALAPAGYRSSMFSCQNERWGNMLNYLDTPGLAVLRHSLDWKREPRRGRGAESKVFEETVVNEWQRWRRGRPVEPFFAYLNFQANHYPYEVPDDEPQPFQPAAIDFPASFLRYPRDKVPVMLNRFHNALAYGDRQLGRVLDFLDETGVAESTIVIVVSDHGEAFYEHGQPTHGTSLYEEQLRSLWMMRIPGATPRVVAEPVSLLDVAPTLLGALGLPAHGNFQGRDVLAPGYEAAGRPLFFTIQGLTLEDGVLLDGWKFIVNWDRRRRSLYNLRDDPGETVNRIEDEAERVRRLERRLGGFLNRQLAYYEERRWERGLYPAALP